MSYKLNLKINSIIVGPLFTNCYTLHNDEEGIIIDPGGEPEKIIELLERNKIKIKLIVNTHCHIDHISANKDIIDYTNAPLSTHKDDEVFLSYKWEIESKDLGIIVNTPNRVDKYLKDGDVISIGDISLKVLHTPGHSPGSICLHTDNILISGDTLFNCGVGRWDLPYSDHNSLIESIRNKLLILDDKTVVYPGHGPTTTIGFEKNNNPFI
ncbi:MAG: MBL fold metallo-hydrolase [bacterium]